MKEKIENEITNSCIDKALNGGSLKITPRIPITKLFDICLMTNVVSEISSHCNKVSQNVVYLPNI